MEFFTDLPKSGKYNTILVVIDQMTTMSHFIPGSKDLDARQFANLVMKEIVRQHRLPQDIITDEGTLFTTDQWKESNKKLGVKPGLSTAFHPLTDGQIKGTNAKLEQSLRA